MTASAIPQDINDAALAASVYLCSGEDDLANRAGQESALFRYDRSDEYVNLVLRIMEAYFSGDFTSVPSGAQGGTTFTPDYSSTIASQREIVRERAVRERRERQQRASGGGGFSSGGSRSGGTSSVVPQASDSGSSTPPVTSGGDDAGSTVKRTTDTVKKVVEDSTGGGSGSGEASVAPSVVWLTGSSAPSSSSSASAPRPSLGVHVELTRIASTRYTGSAALTADSPDVRGTGTIHLPQFHPQEPAPRPRQHGATQVRPPHPPTRRLPGRNADGQEVQDRRQPTPHRHRCPLRRTPPTLKEAVCSDGVCAQHSEPMIDVLRPVSRASPGAVLMRTTCLDADCEATTAPSNTPRGCGSSRGSRPAGRS